MAPPKTQPPVERGRPNLRRPLRRRRPQVDYYYDDEEYEDDYREERFTRRRKPLRSRTRRPDYDDYTDQNRRYEGKSDPRVISSDRTRDEYDYEDSSATKRRQHASENRRFNNERNDRHTNQDDKRFNSERRNINVRNGSNRMRLRPNYDERTFEVNKQSERPTRYEDNDYDDHKYTSSDQGNEPPKVRPTGSGSSIYARPRAPPKINRPVPITDRKKYDYFQPVNSKLPIEDDYEDYDKENEPIELKLDQKKLKAHGSIIKKEVSTVNLTEDNKAPVLSEENVNENRTADKKRLSYPSSHNQQLGIRQATYTNLQQETSILRKHQPASSTVVQNEYILPLKANKNIPLNTQQAKAHYNHPTTSIENQNSNPSFDAEYDEPRPAVRVLKRPFLPSRGGSPYLPRGLRPVGIKEPEQLNLTTNSERFEYTSSHESKINNISLRNSPVESSRITLDNIYNSELDITLNDALNPAIDPITSSRTSPVGFSTSTKYVMNPQTKSYISSGILNSASSRHDLLTQMPTLENAKSTSDELYDDYDY